jgi:hypothetical protein
MIKVLYAQGAILFKVFLTSLCDFCGDALKKIVNNCKTNYHNLKLLCRKDLTVISTEAPVSSVEDRNGGEVEKSVF